MKALRQSAVAVVLAVLVVTAAAGSPALQDESPVGESKGLAVSGTAIAIGIAVGAATGYVTHEILDDGDTVNYTKTDATQTKIDIYVSASGVKSQTDTLQTAYGNHLKDSRNVARRIGKNAYIRALENDSTKSQAKLKAKQAVADYYAQKQMNLIAAWNNQVTHLAYLRGVARNESGLSASYIAERTTNAGPSFKSASLSGTGSKTLTLVNSSSVSAKTVQIRACADSDNGCKSHSIGPSMGNTWVWAYINSDNYGASATGVIVKAPNSNYDQMTYMDFSEFASTWSKIEQQNQQVQQNIGTYVNATYDDWAANKINTTDLVDPYLGARQYSPTNSSQYGSWALLASQAAGVTTPADLDQVGKMNVSTGSQTYTGIVLTDGMPPNKTLKAGTTYNASKIAGLQAVVTQNRMVELTGTFTVRNITTASGAKRQKVSYNKVVYKTATLSEYHKKMLELMQKRAQVEARENAMDGGGGGLLGGGSISPTVALALLAALGAVVVLGNSGGRRRR